MRADHFIGVRMKITLELEPADVARFEQAMDRARELVRSAAELEIVDAAKHALDTLPIGNCPGYIRSRILRVQRLICLLEDEHFALPQAARREVVKALVYFADPDDLIPDHVPGIGLLDDAIMLELLLRSQRVALEAYDEFCAFRTSLGPAPAEPAARRAWQDRLAAERVTLHARMQKRGRRLFG